MTEWTKERHEAAKARVLYYGGRDGEDFVDALAEIDRLQSVNEIHRKARDENRKDIERLIAEASVAKERLGPAGYRILVEVLKLRRVAEAAEKRISHGEYCNCALSGGPSKGERHSEDCCDCGKMRTDEAVKAWREGK